MDYLTERFENTPAGLRQKDARTRVLASEGYRIITEQIEQGHINGQEQCCWALICLPGIFLAKRTPGFIIVTYGREAVSPLPPAGRCTCGAPIQSDSSFCESCGAKVTPEMLSTGAPPDLATGKKVCPFCAEEIQAAAKKCRYCGEFLPPDSVEPGSVPNEEQS